MKDSYERGIITRYIDLYLTCFTDANMFKWFNNNVNTYLDVHSLEANFIIINKNNFVSHLIMKAWVTCALDQNCKLKFDSLIIIIIINILVLFFDSITLIEIKNYFI